MRAQVEQEQKKEITKQKLDKESKATVTVALLSLSSDSEQVKQEYCLQLHTRVVLLCMYKQYYAGKKMTN